MRFKTAGCIVRPYLYVGGQRLSTSTGYPNPTVRLLHRPLDKWTSTASACAQFFEFKGDLGKSSPIEECRSLR
jgi:hypothetical protein